MGLASLILGIIGLILAFIPGCGMFFLPQFGVTVKFTADRDELRPQCMNLFRYVHKDASLLSRLSSAH